jgi:hypothetical protein
LPEIQPRRGSDKKLLINRLSGIERGVVSNRETHKSPLCLPHHILKIAQVARRSSVPKGKRGNDIHSVAREVVMNREKGAYGDGYAGKQKAFPSRKGGAAFARPVFSARRRMNHSGSVPLHERRTINVTERQIL